MINSFLVTLTNLAVGPTNGSSTSGDLLWPEVVPLKTYTGDTLLVYSDLFGPYQTGMNRLLRAIQLTMLVEDSPYRGYTERDDPRKTYTRQQLLGQFSGASYDPLAFSTLLALPLRRPPTELLGEELADHYRRASSALDRLALIAVRFGLRE